MFRPKLICKETRAGNGGRLMGEGRLFNKSATSISAPVVRVYKKEKTPSNTSTVTISEESVRRSCKHGIPTPKLRRRDAKRNLTNVSAASSTCPDSRNKSNGPVRGEAKLVEGNSPDEVWSPMVNLLRLGNERLVDITVSGVH